MKKWILLSGLMCCMFGVSFAQSSIEFIPTGGYTFGDKLDFANSFGRVDAAFNYGGSFQFNFNRHLGIEIAYNRMQTPAKLYNYGAIPGDAANLSDQCGNKLYYGRTGIQVSITRFSGFIIHGCGSRCRDFYSVSKQLFQQCSICLWFPGRCGYIC